MSNITKTIQESRENFIELLGNSCPRDLHAFVQFAPIVDCFNQSQIDLIDLWIANLESSKKEGLQEKEYTDGGQTYTCPSCKECGDYDDCDCSGYNSALEDQISSLNETLEELKKSL